MTPGHASAASHSNNCHLASQIHNLGLLAPHTDLVARDFFAEKKFGLIKTHNLLLILYPMSALLTKTSFFGFAGKSKKLFLVAGKIRPVEHADMLCDKLHHTELLWRFETRTSRLLVQFSNDRSTVTASKVPLCATFWPLSVMSTTDIFIVV